MNNPNEETNPNLQRYLKADGWFDRHVSPIVASPWSLAIFVAWTVGCIAFGFWAGLKP